MSLNLQKCLGLAVILVMLGAAPFVAAKDAPKPKAPPSDWRKYIFEDIKAPTPRPKPSAAPLGLKGSSAPSAAQPKPTAPPTVWLKYINEDIKAPKPRPKPSSALPGVGSLGSSRIPTAKDAPPPTAPPTVHLKYVGEDYKPKPRPKPSSAMPQAGVLPLRTLPSATPLPPKRPPYMHPRDLKDFTGDIRKDNQGPPPPR